MELRQYCQAVKSINDHIADKKAERDELIKTARTMHNITLATFDDAYKKASGHCPCGSGKWYITCCGEDKVECESSNSEKDQVEDLGETLTNAIKELPEGYKLQVKAHRCGIHAILDVQVIPNDLGFIEICDTESSDSTGRSIEVDPGKWDDNIIDCPFADADCYCVYLTSGAAVQCAIAEGNEAGCPLNAGPIKVTLAATKPETKIEAADEFYIQNPKMNHGGFMRFWTKGNHGYSPDISVARVFTSDEIEVMQSIKYEEKIAWPKEYIDTKAVDKEVRLKACDIESSHKVGKRAGN